MTRKRLILITFITLAFIIAVAGIGGGLAAQTIPTTDDALIHMPGTQPSAGIDIADSASCARCHADYNPAVEPDFNWQGSMMAQAARDFLFWPAMTVAIQDSMHALGGNPNAGDICERCHFPGGWLAGRSEPANASSMRGEDFDGVTCDFCHRLYDPFHEETYAGTREGSDWSGYWDESNLSTTPSGAAAAATYAQDAADAATTTFFNTSPFYGVDQKPVSEGYTENGGGQFFVSASEDRRASFAETNQSHDRLYSRYHKSRTFCGTCHDVSNPVLANLGADPTDPLPTETDPASAYYHVERTYSEFAASAYGRQGGAAGIGPFAPDSFDTSQPGDLVASCQDCHMRDVTGLAATAPDTVLRPDGSVEHPKSGLPLHDMTGGNAWVATVLASTLPDSPNYDPINQDLLWNKATTLTLDLSAGIGMDAAALLAGAERAKQQLELAAAIENLSYDAVTGEVSFRIRNQTGHKLISGYPEGRRMFVTIKLLQDGAVIHEVNPYDAAVGTLKGMPDAPLGAGESYADALVYEVKPSSTDILSETTTFHFVLATSRYKDNRIPPQGFDLAEAAERLIVPVWEGAEAPDLYSAAEYAGGYDAVTMTLPTGADSVEVGLYYQTTSREYVNFLRHEINGTAASPALPPDAYIVQTDPFFAGLKGWGDTIWELWEHNKDLPGAAPYLMAQAATEATLPTCPSGPPVLLSATASGTDIALLWSDEHTADGNITGYSVYYDQAGKALWVADVAATTTHVDSGLTPRQAYCYRVSARYSACESDLSNMLCATAVFPWRIWVPSILR